MDIKSILKDNNFSFSKRFGQNFIFDTNLLDAIATDAQIDSEDIVIEVGAGAGTLTKALAKKAKKVISFEIDKALVPVLEASLKDLDNIEIKFKDILKVSYDELNELCGGQKYKVVANLPYYITTPIIFYFLDDENCASLSIMVQKEVAERLTALPNTPAYGAITAQIGVCAKAQITRIVKRNMFTPEPNVDSSVVKIDVLDSNRSKILRRVIAAAFDMRRKTLVNNLVKSFSLSKEKACECVSMIGHEKNVRGEALNKDDFIKLSKILENV